jgi:ABC-type transporter Mla MlaB component
MNESNQEIAVATQLILDETLDISLIHDFYTKLRDTLKSSGTVEIDAGKVSRIDTAAFQLLCSWYKTATDKGVDIVWKNTEGYFCRSARLLGVHKTLGIENV